LYNCPEEKRKEKKRVKKDVKKTRVSDGNGIVALFCGEKKKKKKDVSRNVNECVFVTST
jgi:hypothetical protein